MTVDNQSKTEKKKKDVSSQKTKIDEKIEKLVKENKELKEELKNSKDRLLRSLADFQNYQKRMQKELQHIEEETKIRYLNEIIDIYELLKKAYEDKNPKQALELIIRNIESLLKNNNITYIDCIGKPFDHNLHHAVTAISVDGYEDNTVVDEIKKGYMIGEKLLRPSQVVVAKKKKK
ncbi:MAG TPA: nucleotide exchange factor GrpE [Thermoplasmatales archaeon]|nr:nucleotide exchange factor GrpE [Thermoplasmatales archaeon]